VAIILRIPPDTGVGPVGVGVGDFVGDAVGVCEAVGVVVGSSLAQPPSSTPPITIRTIAMSISFFTLGFYLLLGFC
jgi:hypothetical protein